MLEIQGVRVVYPNGYQALASVDMTARNGEIVALIGRSGAGKSTLLRTINGLQRVTEGRIRLDGKDISAMVGNGLQDLRRSVGFVWQEFNLVDRLPVLDNVLCGRLGYNRGVASLFRYFSSADREIAVRSLERVNLVHRATNRADRLSGGEKQRVAIARALAQQPRVLLADEPVASLDVELSWHVMSDLVRVARDEGVPTILSIHQVDLATAFADRIVGIAQGRVVFDGTPETLTEDALDRIYRFDVPADLRAMRRRETAPREAVAV